MAGAARSADGDSRASIKRRAVSSPQPPARTDGHLYPGQRLARPGLLPHAAGRVGPDRGGRTGRAASAHVAGRTALHLPSARHDRTPRVAHVGRPLHRRRLGAGVLGAADHPRRGSEPLGHARPACSGRRPAHPAARGPAYDAHAPPCAPHRHAIHPAGAARHPHFGRAPRAGLRVDAAIPSTLALVHAASASRHTGGVGTASPRRQTFFTYLPAASFEHAGPLPAFAPSPAGAHRSASLVPRRLHDPGRGQPHPADRPYAQRADRRTQPQPETPPRPQPEHTGSAENRQSRRSRP